MNLLAHYNKYAMGWMIRGSGFESRWSREFSFRYRVNSGFGVYPVAIKGFRHRGMTLTTFLTSLLALKVKQESHGLPWVAVTVLYPCDCHWWSLVVPIKSGKGLKFCTFQTRVDRV